MRAGPLLRLRDARRRASRRAHLRDARARRHDASSASTRGPAPVTTCCAPPKCSRPSCRPASTTAGSVARRKAFGVVRAGDRARPPGRAALPSPEAAQRLAAARCERRDDIDVLVVGGGVAGLSAALAAADEGPACCSSSRTTGSAAGWPIAAARRMPASDAAPPVAPAVDGRIDGRRSRRSPARRRSAGTRKASSRSTAGRTCCSCGRRRSSSRPAATTSACRSPAGTCPGVMLAQGARRLLRATRRAAGLASRRPHDGRPRLRRRAASCASAASRSPAWPTAGRRRRSGSGLGDDVAAMGARSITGTRAPAHTGARA